ncbi:hypothetical protein FNU79_04620 [Deinococcus detaillensis]|uniref:Uncharacterized protein n=1 Tax=Deinococcus detaillensis TaxID=2592048 RepID=A0A553V3V8_9DEIO|nr:hypothetical protein [Deinococcus detaillensis]TSA87180.1 hypothetical protein FNU79_04620 [Deinococcus detaillensis]
MSRPDVEKLTDQLLQFLDEEKIVANPNFTEELYKSGVYSVIDCVFSSMAVHKTVVVPAINRFRKNQSLQDIPELKFTSYLEYARADLERPTKERFDEIASKDFDYRGVIAGRRKVEVVYDVCQRFVHKGLETIHDVQALPKGEPFTCESPGTQGELEKFVMGGIAGVAGYDSPNVKVRGIGLALGAYLVLLLGDETFVKPDTQLFKVMGRIGRWSPRASNVEDFQLVRQAISCAAAQRDVTPASLDNALWAYQSGLQKTASTKVALI